MDNLKCKNQYRKKLNQLENNIYKKNNIRKQCPNIDPQIRSKDRNTNSR